MADQAAINAVVDIIVGEFSGNAELFQAFLHRARLQTELAQLESAARTMQATEDVQNAEFREAMSENVAAQTAKRAEIDAL